MSSSHSKHEDKNIGAHSTTSVTIDNEKEKTNNTRYKTTLPNSHSGSSTKSQQFDNNEREVDSIGDCNDIEARTQATLPFRQNTVNNPSTAPTECTQKTGNSVVIYQQKFFKYKLAKQICLMGIYICIGLTSEMAGPTLPDLKDRIGVNYEEISRSMVGKSVGILFGSVIGSYLHEVLSDHVDMLNTCSLLMMSSAAYILPWSKSVASAAAVFCLHGLGHGSVQVGSNVMVMHLWREKATCAIMSLNLAFGIGAFLSPWIASPFLSTKEKGTVDDNHITTESPNFPELQTSYNPLSEENFSRIEIPYSIVGTVIFLFSFVAFGFYLKGPPLGFPARKRSKIKEMTSPGSCSSGHNSFGTTLFICLFLYFLNGVGGEKSYGKFLFSYAFEEGILTKRQAYFIQSAFWMSFTAGRLLGVPITTCVEVRKIMVVDIVIIVLSTICLVNFAGTHPLVLWIFTVIMGMSIARIYPSGMAFANLQLTMNSIGVLVLILGGTAGEFIYMYITGFLFETTGPHALMYVMVGFGICLAISAALMLTVAKVMPHESPYDISIEIQVEDRDSQVETEL